jgi:hypothetical protein
LKNCDIAGLEKLVIDNLSMKLIGNPMDDSLSLIVNASINFTSKWVEFHDSFVSGSQAGWIE